MFTERCFRLMALKKLNKSASRVMKASCAVGALFVAVHESAFGRYCCKRIFGIGASNIDSKSGTHVHY
jgi:hypothetical protein